MSGSDTPKAPGILNDVINATTTTAKPDPVPIMDNDKEMENSKSMENVSDQILKVPPDEQKPEPPLVKDEGAAEL